MDKIRIETINFRGFDRQTGETVVVPTVEFVCEDCRHIVNLSDKFCQGCGGSLQPPNATEYYYGTSKINKADFENIKTMKPSDIKSFLKTKAKLTIEY